jgi:hypothetical protein
MEIFPHNHLAAAPSSHRLPTQSVVGVLLSVASRGDG